MYVFDVLWLDGHDVRRLPLRTRKRLLRDALRFHGNVRWTQHRNRDGETFFVEACRKGWEGLIAKRADSPYMTTRSRDWLKFKCEHGQELVIGGFTAAAGLAGRVRRAAARLLQRRRGSSTPARSGPGSTTELLHSLGAQLRELRAEGTRRSPTRRRSANEA